MVVCCQGASDKVVPVVAVEEVEELLVEVVDPLVVPVVPVPPEVAVPPVVPDPPVVLVEVPSCPVVDVLGKAAESPVATTDVRGRSVTSAPAALTAT
jgi:hypothetical protein